MQDSKQHRASSEVSSTDIDTSARESTLETPGKRKDGTPKISRTTVTIAVYRELQEKSEANRRIVQRIHSADQSIQQLTSIRRRE